MRELLEGRALAAPRRAMCAPTSVGRVSDDTWPAGAGSSDGPGLPPRTRCFVVGSPHWTPRPATPYRLGMEHTSYWETVAQLAAIAIAVLVFERRGGYREGGPPPSVGDWLQVLVAPLVPIGVALGVLSGLLQDSVQLRALVGLALLLFLVLAVVASLPRPQRRRRRGNAA